MQARTNTTPSLDVNIVKAFVEATVHAFSVQLGMAASPQKPFLKGTHEMSGIDIAGSIALRCPVFQGTVALCFPATVFLSIYNGMTGEALTEISKDCQDAAAELLNIIFGVVKAKLNNERNYGIEKAIPSVILGKGSEVPAGASVSTLVLPFATDTGSFYVEFLADNRSTK